MRYTKLRFAFEENLIAKASYSLLKEHVLAHKLFITKLARYIGVLSGEKMFWRSY